MSSYYLSTLLPLFYASLLLFLTHKLSHTYSLLLSLNSLLKQCMVFVRTKLIPTEGLLALTPKSSAISFGPDATSTATSTSSTSPTECVSPVGCVGGLLFAITVLGVKFCFISVRLSHGIGAQDIRKKEVTCAFQYMYCVLVMCFMCIVCAMCVRILFKTCVDV